ncbi:MAG: hypothetical protein AAF716_04540 [Cyanobacteria bacterium P01_D01_bin.1]
MLKIPSIAVTIMTRLRGSIHPGSCDNIKKDLDELRRTLNSEVLDVSECLRDYTSLVDNYYSNCPPFGSGNEQKDFQDFIEIIAHSIVICNYTLLDRWAVEYPQKNQHKLAAPLAQYVHKIDGVVKTQWTALSGEYKWPPQARDYCHYLVKNLAQVRI